ncbi:hypothetical protein GCM10010503_39350 [Streptomyces lucensis JCM 4490]|uniref:Uncharacterized protein n=1 Tax=Streptomyces lucensis JCM 4490 TaxID=1306176 RepID=A0A918MS91_9ACTN|nr:hypothetical protein GCM10010503_39350 [Streptomyces lucensis JCM 4490]
MGALAVVAEVDIAEGLGGDLAELVLGETGPWAWKRRAAWRRGSARGRWCTRASSVLPGAAV